jgi:hypothetical protein
MLNIEDVKLQLIVSIADAGLITLDPGQKASLSRYFPLSYIPPYPSLALSAHRRSAKT